MSIYKTIVASRVKEVGKVSTLQTLLEFDELIDNMILDNPNSKFAKDFQAIIIPLMTRAIMKNREDGGDYSSLGLITIKVIRAAFNGSYKFHYEQFLHRQRMGR